MRLSLIAVTHRSAAVLPAAVESFRAQAAVAGVEPEVVVVDHSEDAAEEERVRGCGPDRLLAQSNRGFAAGINAGVAAASGETLLLANPDLRFLDGSVSALLAALTAGWDVVGPQFELSGLLLPPSDLQTPGETLGRGWAERSRAAWERRLRGEARRWRQVWEATEPMPATALSGALLALRASIARRLGPMDEGYFLYFEETDWLRRAASLGAKIAQVPAARIEHRWGHAAAPAEFADRYARSRRRYLRRHHRWTGGWADRLAVRVSRGFSPSAAGNLPQESPQPGTRLEWLVSASPRLFPAALARGESPPCEALRTFLEAAPVSELYVGALAPAAGTVYGPWTVG